MTTHLPPHPLITPLPKSPDEKAKKGGGESKEKNMNWLKMSHKIISCILPHSKSACLDSAIENKMPVQRKTFLNRQPNAANIDTDQHNGNKNLLSSFGKYSSGFQRSKRCSGTIKVGL